MPFRRRQVVCRLSLLVQISFPATPATVAYRKVAGRRTHLVLLDLVQQRPVADFQQPRRGFAIPAGLVERGGDGIALGLALYTLDQDFKPEIPG